LNHAASFNRIFGFVNAAARFEDALSNEAMTRFCNSISAKQGTAQWRALLDAITPKLKTGNRNYISR